MHPLTEVTVLLVGESVSSAALAGRPVESGGLRGHGRGGRRGHCGCGGRRGHRGRGGSATPLHGLPERQMLNAQFAGGAAEYGVASLSFVRSTDGAGHTLRQGRIVRLKVLVHLALIVRLQPGRNLRHTYVTYAIPTHLLVAVVTECIP